MTLDLTTRQTFWNITFGSFCTWTAYLGLNQSCVQRMVSLPNLQNARRLVNYSINKYFISIIFVFIFSSMLIFVVGVTIVLGSCHVTGIVMFSYYYDCDPLKAGVNEL